ncbi:MAG: copper homeostasis protein CutC [Bacteroidaceae bacterium]|nr:copper homeostasis protein CutC [Bacteroidaceae bacterium]MBR0543139.1 copper homeostasis protein CutC [Bacteroidaceae bacterium]
MRKLEVCCGDLQSVRAAIEGGAHRVELCEALELDGLTPSEAMMESAIGMGIPVQVLIRVREGDFVYNKAEICKMRNDIRLARELGAAGVVIGALMPDGSIDEEAIRCIMDEAGGLSVTFHRAFDVCREPEEALEKIISLGCHRLLTSGQATTAEQGIPMLKKLVEQADGRIIIMPGAGVNPQNASRILEETGALEIHGSLRRNGHTSAELVRATLNNRHFSEQSFTIS